MTRTLAFWRPSYSEDPATALAADVEVGRPLELTLAAGAVHFADRLVANIDCHRSSTI